MAANLLGHDFSMFSLIGLVALSGVVVNDSLVLIDAANGYRKDGQSAMEAIVRAGKRRAKRRGAQGGLRVGVGGWCN